MGATGTQFPLFRADISSKWMHSCFNAFSRVDMRVDVKIPGGVKAYVVDLRGEQYVAMLPVPPLVHVAHENTATYRHEATPEVWQETYVSALLRAILYSDDPTYTLEAYRKLDPITTAEGELRFLQAAEALFSKGTCISLVLGGFNSNLMRLDALVDTQVGKWALTLKSKSPPSYRTTSQLGL
jgi:hypothetical protein